MCEPPAGYPEEIIGYAEPWIVNPGQTVDIKISSTEPEYSYVVVRLIQGHDGDHAPMKKEEVVRAIPAGIGKGRYQQANPGSFARVDDIGLVESDEGVEISLFFQPHLVKADHLQTIVSSLNYDQKTGYEVAIDESGEVVLFLGSGQTIQGVSSGYFPSQKSWVKLTLIIQEELVEFSFDSVMQHAQKPQPSRSKKLQLDNAANISNPGPLFIAARPNPDRSAKLQYIGSQFFNGRVEAVTICSLGSQPRLLVKYDFAQRMSSDVVVDISGSSCHGRLINAPTRAVKGHNWDGSETDWTKADSGYGAIHFHEDDLDDAGWSTDFTIKIPGDSRSGAYAVQVKSIKTDKTQDNITFFVRRPETSTAKVALVLSTFTYLAYANEHMYDLSKPSALKVPTDNFTFHKDEDFSRMERRSDLGLSMYDVHRDLSGVVFSSSKRPILNIRPGYIHWAFKRPREFSADLLMIGFLEDLGLDYDVCYDHDLHIEGIAAIDRYTTVMTGSHPEYPTLRSLNAYADFAKLGGNIMYLGGNGFYWMSALDNDRPHRLEVRRGDQGVKTFGLPGSERHHSLTGAQGGLWRSRGRAANYLFGVGCCGEGLGPGVPYKRTSAAYEPTWSWMFDGIHNDELLGEYGFGGGASGDEIDRFDLENGSPSNTVVLATSTGHSDEFGIFPEDADFPLIRTLGTQTNKIRSDLTIYETSAGGHIFAVGSINWYCSLGWDGYKNNIALLTANVLRRFENGRL